MAFVADGKLDVPALLEAAREYWDGKWEGRLFYHISTDEVYGALALTDPAGGPQGRGPTARSLYRTDEVRPPQPLFGFEGLVRPLRAGLPRHLRHATLVTNCSNNYGPTSFPRS